MCVGGGSGADGSAGGVRESRPIGALTGQPSAERSLPGGGTFSANRSDLPGSTAMDIAFNPASKQSTTSEKVGAAAQIAIPGGALVGLARAISMSARTPGPSRAAQNFNGDARANALAAPRKEKLLLGQ